MFVKIMYRGLAQMESITDDMEVAEISQALGCSSSLVNKEINEIKRELTEILTEEGFIV